MMMEIAVDYPWRKTFVCNASVKVYQIAFLTNEIESIIIFPQYLRAKPMRIVIMKMVTAMLVSANAPLILSMPKIVQFPDVSSYSQSHYIEVLWCLS